MYGHAAVGHDQIAKTLGKTGKVVMSVPGITPLRHFLSTQSVHVHSVTEATSTTYVTVVGANGVDHWGAYLDRWSNDGNRWRITHRTIALDGFIPGSAGERFGVGPHRCLGLHLARLTMSIAIEEWHKVIPEYRVPDGSDVVELTGGIAGIHQLPLQWSVA